MLVYNENGKLKNKMLLCKQLINENVYKSNRHVPQPLSFSDADLLNV